MGTHDPEELVDDGVDTSEAPPEDEKVMSLIDHLSELRIRLLISLGSLLVVGIVTLYFSKDITRLILRTAPTMTFQVLSPTEAVFIQIKVALLTALLIAFPVIASQAWAFVKPGLKPEERHYLKVYFPLSGICFLIGVAFAYFIVIPIGIGFLMEFAKGLAEVQYTLESYTSFVLFFLLIFGLLFQSPFVLIVLAQVGVVNSEMLASWRRPVITLIFVASAILTPTTDLVVQSLLAIPACILYELTIRVLRLMRL